MKAIFGLAGWSGAGKTTLLEKLVRTIVASGVTVSTIKDSHHGFDVDKPGKDSYRHREAGATEVLVSSPLRWALMHELRGAPQPKLEELVAHMSPVDLLLVEGFRSHPFPKLEIFRPSLGKPPLWPNAPHIVAVASDEPLEGVSLPVFHLDAPEAIAEFILRQTGLVPQG
jgi:molybdopterin-guanine dinucleotide biosynthesis protein B